MLTVEPAGRPPGAAAELGTWRARRWATAAVGALATAVLIGVPTDVIPNPWFGRPVAVTWWSIPVLVASSVLAGLLLATYVRDDAGASAPGTAPDDADAHERTARRAGLGGLLTFFAVGCPVCNKLVVVALGTSGALSWFQPLQPLLAVASVALLAVALRSRLRAATACPAPSAPAA